MQTTAPAITIRSDCLRAMCSNVWRFYWAKRMRVKNVTRKSEMPPVSMLLLARNTAYIRNLRNFRLFVRGNHLPHLLVGQTARNQIEHLLLGDAGIFQFHK